MKLTAKCPGCGVRIEADTDLIGKKANCPNCNDAFVVPATSVIPGMVLDDFWIQRKIASGPVAEVFIGKEMSSSKQMALKVLSPALSETHGGVKALVDKVVTPADEAAHPGLVAVAKAGKIHGCYFLAMPYVEGEDLGERLVRTGASPEAEALVLARLAADALRHGYEERGLLHGKVNPSKIMICPDGAVKLLDLGILEISRAVAAERAQDLMKTTPDYFSPEQLAGNQHDSRSDIYALGATIYRALCGRAPFEGAAAVLQGGPIPANETNPEVSAATAELIQTMMARDPAERYQSYADLIDDLDALLRDNHGLTNQTTLPDRPAATPATPVAAAVSASAVEQPAAPPPGKRSRRGLAAAAVVLICATAVFSWRLANYRPAAAFDLAAPTRMGAGRRYQKLEAALKDAATYASEHPADFDGAIERFKQVRTDAVGTALLDRANEAIEQVRAARAKMLAAAEAEAARAAEKERQATAAAAQKQERQRQIEEQRQAAKRKREEQKKARQDAVLQKRQATGLFASFVARTAQQVGTGAPAAALAEIAAAKADKAYQPVRPQLDELQQLVTELTKLDELILRSFEQQKGRTVSIKFKKRQGKVRIRGVASAKVVGQIARRRGSSSLRDYAFGVGDLSREEKVARLGRSGLKDGAFVQGLYALQEDDFDAAEQHFKEAKGTLAKPMAAYVGKARAERANEGARQALPGLLKAASLPADQTDAAALKERLARQYYSEKDADRASRAAQAYLAKYGATAVASEYKELLNKLSGLPPTRARSQVMDGMKLWLAAGELTVIDSKERLQEWRSKTGGSMLFTQDDAARSPHLERDGRKGRPALLFNGRGDHISSKEFGKKLLAKSTAVTVTAWIRSDSSTSASGFFLAQGAKARQDFIALGYTSAGKRGRNVISAEMAIGGKRLTIESPSRTQAKGKWQCLAFTWDSGQPMELYINGESVEPSFRSKPIEGALVALETIVVGKGLRDSRSSSWRGMVEDVRIFDRVLSSGEIDDIANDR